jgi:hypothetical protein
MLASHKLAAKHPHANRVLHQNSFAIGAGNATGASVHAL